MSNVIPKPLDGTELVAVLNARSIQYVQVSDLLSTSNPSGSAKVTARRLMGMYEAQRLQDQQVGPMLLPRTGLPVAADVPTITSLTTAPSADSDAATQVIYPFGSDLTNVDPIPPAALKKKSYLRGFNHGLRCWGQLGWQMQLSSTVAQYNAAGNTGIDPSINYGTSSGVVTADFILDGDVLFFRSFAGTGNTFELYVNGSLCVTTPGSGVSAGSNGRGYYQTSNGNTKLKFASAGRRRITLVFPAAATPGIFYTRATSTITPVVVNPLMMVWMGDSFSQYTGASTATVSLVEWIHAGFGRNLDFINLAIGSTSFAGPGQNFPDQAPVTNQRPSMHQQYLLGASKLNYDVLGMLIGINDSGNDQTAFMNELSATLTQITTDRPNALVFVVASNASPTTIANGKDVVVENNVAAVCVNFPTVKFIPLQTADAGKFLRGTGWKNAATGVGNTDLYTGGTDGNDSVHPSDAGHRGYGQYVVNRMYESLDK